uniref:Uncharacterized protein n=1 Tax=Eutreptiella gymnastica TaxID=73025 RepID=A0A7S4D3C4_9EUGL
MFLALGEYVADVTLPQGTCVCGYAKGTFHSAEEGDKSVMYSFNGPDNLVFYNKQLMPLREAIVSAVSEAQPPAAGEAVDLQDTLLGHTVLVLGPDQVEIVPEENFTARYFVPDDVPFDDLGIISFGMYANDLAWMGPATTSEAYAERSASHNVLQLVWRMAWDTDRGCLVPTWPVVALGQDLRLCNKEPMEVGIQYGWRYWDALVKQGKSAGGIVA